MKHGTLFGFLHLRDLTPAAFPSHRSLVLVVHHLNTGYSV